MILCFACIDITYPSIIIGMNDNHKDKSIWETRPPEDLRRYGALEGDLRTDVLVIGGGMAGYLTAYRLAATGRKVTLVEGYRLFSGTTAKSTAKITYHQGEVYPTLVKNYGSEVAAMYYAAQCDGMRGYYELVKRHCIDCDWQMLDSYVYSRREEQTEKLLDAMLKAGIACRSEKLEYGGSAVSAVKAENQFSFDPLRFLRALPVNFDIYENTRVIAMDAENRLAVTPNGNIKADTIVVATRYPIIDSHGSYFFKLRPSMSYTIAVKGAQADATYLDIRENGLSIRPYGGGVTIGGCDRRTGTKGNDAFAELERSAAEFFPGKEIEARWSAQDGVTFDGLPYIGSYSPELRGVYVIAGFGKWGMANSMVAANLITDLVEGRREDYAEIFSPSRKTKGAAGGYVRHAFRSAAYIVLGNLHYPLVTARKIRAGEGKVVNLNGKKRAVYKEADGRLFAIEAMCPHLHAELKWNPLACTWDCPCHGSRFDRYGNVLCAPAVRSCKGHKGK